MTFTSYTDNNEYGTEELFRLTNADSENLIWSRYIKVNGEYTSEYTIYLVYVMNDGEAGVIFQCCSYGEWDVLWYCKFDDRLCQRKIEILNIFEHECVYESTIEKLYALPCNCDECE